MADCPICSKPLAVGTSVVYKGDPLIHAVCWGDKPDAPGKPDLNRRTVPELRVQLVPAFEDARRLWAVWVVEWGGEGIVLKDGRSIFRPGARAAHLVEGEAQAHPAPGGSVGASLPLCAECDAQWQHSGEGGTCTRHWAAPCDDCARLRRTARAGWPPAL